jgi:hypothetical protein
MKLRLKMEEVPATGAITATGALNALGRPAIDRWDLFTRETVQNSWDAKLPGDPGPVRYEVRLRRLTAAQHRALVEEVMPETPDDGKEEQWDPLEDPSRHVISVSDWGTRGLGGSTRADRIGSGPADFADFVWNVGQPPDNARGGGTYGYGKSVFYRASAASTIVIYSRCRFGGTTESRFIAAALGKPFAESSGGPRFTGRHWWGILKGNAAPVQPATGELADQLARSLGMPVRSGSQTGTTIMVLAADIEAPPGVVASRIRSAILWHCWPKLVDLGPGPDMQFRVSCDGGELPPLDPGAHPDLRHFLRTLEAANGKPGMAETFDVRSFRPRLFLGTIGLTRWANTTGREGVADQGSGADAKPFEGACHHVALLRAPGLVVKYLPGPESSTQATAWGGVFVADDDVDRHFAAAETPTHDDWVPKAVPDRRMRSSVTVALRRIGEVLKDYTRPASGGAGIVADRGLGHLSDALGGLLRTDEGTGTGSLPGSGPGSPRKGVSGRRKKTPQLNVIADELVLHDGGPAIRITFAVTAAEGTIATRVTPIARVAVNDGGSVEAEPPANAPVPQLLHFVSPQGSRIRERSLVVPAGDGDRWQALVSVPADTAIHVSLQADGVTS